MQEANADKEGATQKLLLVLGAVAVVVVAGLIVYFARASDPAASGPIPYKKVDYGAIREQREQQNRDFSRRSATDPGTTR